MTLNLCSHPSLLPPSACLFDLFLHTAFKVISTVSPWMPQCYKSEENRPVILVNNAWDQLSLNKKEFWRRPSLAYGWGRDRSTNLLGSSWAASQILQRCTHTHTSTHTNTHLSKHNEEKTASFSNFRMSHVIFVAYTDATLNSFCTKHNVELRYTCVSKGLLEAVVTYNLHQRTHLPFKSKKSSLFDFSK